MKSGLIAFNKVMSMLLNTALIIAVGLLLSLIHI